jgi:Ras-related protein Rab-11A
VVVLLIGNKCDLAEQREVKMESIEEFARSKKCLYLETSAATGQNVNEAFNLVVNSTL